MVPRSLIGFAFLVWGSVYFISRAAFSSNKQVIFRDINRNGSCFLLAATSFLVYHVLYVFRRWSSCLSCFKYVYSSNDNSQDISAVPMYYIVKNYTHFTMLINFVLVKQNDVS